MGKLKRIVEFISYYCDITGGIFSDEILEKILVIIVKIKGADRNFEESSIDIKDFINEVSNISNSIKYVEITKNLINQKMKYKNIYL